VRACYARARVCVWSGEVGAGRSVGGGGRFIKIVYYLIISLNILCPLVKVIIQLFDALVLCQGGLFCEGTGVHGGGGGQVRDEEVT
jgi:hypothetical protein